MNVTTRLTNLGIDIFVDLGESAKPLEPAQDANQTKPRRHYVYAHLDSTEQIFYVGKGTGRRAWSDDRHSLWYRYVERHLRGSYRVRILHDDLSPEDAEEIEALWIAQYSDKLVNWFNMGRDIDLSAVERYHSLRNKNVAMIREAKALEQGNLEHAVTKYVSAIDAIATYASIRFERGLIGQLLDEETEEVGRNGEVQALDRLTLCLVELGRFEEAAQRAGCYFALYRRDLHLGAAKRILKRVEKAMSRVAQTTAAVVWAAKP